MASSLPTNRAPFTLADVVTATGGRLVVEGAEDAVGVSTDTRSIEPKNVFVALIGGRFDGHDHVAVAVERGASIVVVEREVRPPKPGVSVVLVNHTMRALGALARAHRRRWGRSRRAMAPKVIGITGSAGKTTTRAAVASVLTALGRTVHASQENLNNQIGVPLTVLGLESRHDVAVVEIGTNQRGEIAYGSGVSEPDVGVLTLISEAHGEGLGSVWDIAKEKGDLLLALPLSGVAIANGDDPRAAAELLRSPASRWIRYGTNDADVRLVRRTPRGLRGSDVEIAWTRDTGEEVRLEAEIPLLGNAGAYASLAATSVTLAINPTTQPADLARALVVAEKTEPGRLAPSERADGTVVIDDAYNANPASMTASIAAASEIAQRRAAAASCSFSGRCASSGARAEALHRDVAQAIAGSGAAVVIGVGGHARAFTTGLPQGVATSFADDRASARMALDRDARPGDIVLVKGSNSIGLSELAQSFARSGS